jgi:type III secretion system FlhB-like substrate exporter
MRPFLTPFVPLGERWGGFGRSALQHDRKTDIANKRIVKRMGLVSERFIRAARPTNIEIDRKPKLPHNARQIIEIS